MATAPEFSFRETPTETGGNAHCEPKTTKKSNKELTYMLYRKAHSRLVSPTFSFLKIAQNSRKLHYVSTSDSFQGRCKADPAPGILGEDGHSTDTPRDSKTMLFDHLPFNPSQPLLSEKHRGRERLTVTDTEAQALQQKLQPV